MNRPRVGVAVLTMGDRMPELLALLASVAEQDEPAVRVVVVGNGTALPGLPQGVTVVELEENLGVAGGRNVAWQCLRDFGDVDVLVDLDDDGLLIEADVFRRIADLYAAESRLGIVSFRIADETGGTQRRHVPRLRAGDPMRRGLVTTFLGGGHALSMPMLEETGGWPDAFFFTHEETDLAWRAVDRGWDILYEPQLVLRHPKTSPARHAVYYRMTARNRVWLAKRHLPAALVPVYLASWAAYTLVRRPSPAGLKAWWAGFFEGVRVPCPPRRPMRWQTVWRMTRLGRPPVI
ncbi:glycosyltransferase family 2 protein [Streptomyces vinaceus]|uniref:Glycosyltransferase family 2 protein n=1 Tax=Streptomyces vinaceus TaxID=1960 RepID=A0A5J6JIZ0_STRVI|nr:glycosyltransferase family 2 protein [Streptomyces vinaceus]QEV49692.1 glycosyltransferase family 2 protein [Streptomyces vinaceus]GHE25074.1 glycosyl transferase [Streptomyces vinaceus]